MFLQSIEKPSVFHASIPLVPMGKYAHVIILRETNSFPLFQTDQELNFAQVGAGLTTNEIISRIVVFKRKQTTPERLTGRELLRRYNFTTDEEGDDKERYCEYNSEHFCKHCPDCIYYGFAIGQEGSERSKVLVDSAFSLSDYDESHQRMTFNAPYEHGTMSKNGQTRSSFGEQDHVLPQVFFPSIVTMRDPTEAGFIYVLNNILRTKRYGAQTTRTGTLDNHIVAVAFTDGEICSNLKLTQKLYDQLVDDAGHAVKGPYQATHLIKKATDILPTLLKEDRITTHLLIEGDKLSTLVGEVGEIVTQENTLVQVLQQAYSECEDYAARCRPYALGLVQPAPAYFNSTQEPRYEEELQTERVSGCYVTPASPLHIDFSFITFKMAAVPYYSHTPKESKNRVVFGRAKELAPGSTFEFFVFAQEKRSLPTWVRLGKWMAKAEIVYEWYTVGTENAKVVDVKSPQLVRCPINPLDIAKRRLTGFDIVVMPPVSLLTNVRITGSCCLIGPSELFRDRKQEVHYVPLGMRYFSEGSPAR